MAEIWENNRAYTIGRPYVDTCTRVSFRHLSLSGSLPRDCAVIIAPNHTNTLMDALVVLRTRSGPTVFGARADIFRRRIARKLLTFLKILPITRERDGLHNVIENYRSFDEIDATLDAGVPFCMFAEGRHHTDHDVLPLKKGIARIALRSASCRHTCIVPTGINYSSFFRYRGAVEVVYGEPLDVNAFALEHSDLSGAQLHQALLDELRSRIEPLVRKEPLPNPPGWHRLLLPLWPVFALLALPMWLTSELVCRKVLSDKAFSNSVRMIVLTLLGPLTFVIWAIIFFSILPWWAALILLLLVIPSYPLFYDILG